MDHIRQSLASLILQDVRRYWPIILLWFVVILTGIAVVLCTFSTRELTIELEQLRAERDTLDIDWQSMRLEIPSIASHTSVEYEAIHRLNMRFPTQDVERLVNVQ